MLLFLFFVFLPLVTFKPGCATYQPGQHLPERPAMGGRAYSGSHGSRNCSALRREPLYPCQCLYSNGNSHSHIFFLIIHQYLLRAAHQYHRLKQCYNTMSGHLSSSEPHQVSLLSSSPGGVWESHALVRVYFEAAARVRSCQRSTENHSVLPAHQEGTSSALNHSASLIPVVPTGHAHIR